MAEKFGGLGETKGNTDELDPAKDDEWLHGTLKVEEIKGFEKLPTVLGLIEQVKDGLDKGSANENELRAMLNLAEKYLQGMPDESGEAFDLVDASAIKAAANDEIESLRSLVEALGNSANPGDSTTTDPTN